MKAFFGKAARTYLKTIKIVKRLLFLVWVIGSVLFKRNTSGPARLRMFFERAGGAFIKLGQLLSLRCDIFSLSYTKELLRLLGDVAQATFCDIHGIFVEEFGVTVGAFFLEFNAEPVASGSIAQVYSAKLKDGTRVAVKIQRPDAREVFESDFLLISFFASVIDFFRIFSAVYAWEVASEFISWTRKELDFRFEAKNADALYAHSEAHPKTVIPKQFPDISTSRVLIQEFIEDGIGVDKILIDATDKEALLEQDIDLDELAEYLIKDEMRQYFIDGFFHADPHPANLVFAPGNKLVYLDFGIVGDVDQKTRIFFLKILHGIAKQDVESVSRHFFEFAEESLNDDVKIFLQSNPKKKDEFKKVFLKIKEILYLKFESDIEKVLVPWFKSVAKPSVSLHDKSASVVFFRLIREAEGHNVHLPKEIHLFFRALSILDVVSLQLSRDFDIIKALNLFFADYPLEKVEEMIKDGEHEKESGEKIEGTTDIDWEFFQELSMFEKERMLVARERTMELIAYYAERHEEIRSIIKKL